MFYGCFFGRFKEGLWVVCKLFGVLKGFGVRAQVRGFVAWGSGFCMFGFRPKLT